MAILGVFLGYASLAGLLCMILLMPIQGFIMGRMQTLRRAITIVNDQRIKVTNEVLQGVRAVKLYHWEDAYVKIIGKIRNEELSAIRALSIVNAFNMMLISTSPVIVAVVTLTVYGMLSCGITSHA